MKKAAATRLHILQKAFELIYVKGYQATSIDDILATTEVTKGAFYYHFKNKDVMGLAIIEELLKPVLTQSFIAPLQEGHDALDTIFGLIQDLLLHNEFMKVPYGCPASNLTQELCPWHGDFHKALLELSDLWAQGMVAILCKGQALGQLRPEIRPQQVTTFVVAGYWGIRNIGKLAGDAAVYLPYLQELRRYLDGLR